MSPTTTPVMINEAQLNEREKRKGRRIKRQRGRKKETQGIGRESSDEKWWEK